MRILIADDNEDAANTLRMLLEAYDHEVKTAPDGKAALELTDQWSPDVAVLDLRMPVLGGIEAGRVLKVRRPDILWFALTGESTNEARRAAADAGFDGYFEKGVAVSELLRTLEGATANRRSTDEGS